MRPPLAPVEWIQTHRLLASCSPPVDVFDDVADPRDWAALARAQARTGPRIRAETGDRAAPPPARRPSGAGAAAVMAAFTHISPDRGARFSDGGFGVYTAARRLETALREHAHHMGRFYRDAAMPAGWMSEVGQLIGLVNARLADIAGPGYAALLDPDDYTASQAFGAWQRAESVDGIAYPSVRDPGGQCIAAFTPHVIFSPVLANHYRYYWDGAAIAHVRELSGERAIYTLAPRRDSRPGAVRGGAQPRS